MTNKISKQIFTILIILLLSMSSALSQNVDILMNNVVYLSGKSPRIEKVKNKEVEIWIRDPQKSTPEPLELVPYSGTGFLVSHKDKVFLITAQHVAQRVAQNTTMTIARQDGQMYPVQLETLVTTKPISWTYHQHADIAVIQIEFPKNIPGKLTVVPIESIEKTLSAPSVNASLTVIGFPLSFGVQGHFSPIIKTSHAASDIFSFPRSDTANESQFFILDDPAASGFSGAPVFLLPNIRSGVMEILQGEFKIVGVVHGSHGDQAGSKFASIVPAKYILETIEKSLIK